MDLYYPRGFRIVPSYFFIQKQLEFDYIPSSFTYVRLLKTHVLRIPSLTYIVIGSILV